MRDLVQRPTRFCLGKTEFVQHRHRLSGGSQQKFKVRSILVGHDPRKGLHR
jgi:hypothetical protein